MYYISYKGVYVEISHTSRAVFKIDRKVANEYANQIKNLAGIPEDITVEIGGFQTHKDVFERTVNGQTEVCVTFPFEVFGRKTDHKFDLGIAFDNKTGKITEIEFSINAYADQTDPENLLRVFETINQIKNLRETEELKAILEKIDTETRDDVFF